MLALGWRRDASALVSARSGAASGRFKDARAATDAGLDLGVPDRAALPVHVCNGHTDVTTAPLDWQTSLGR
jgi:hypothetical protein